MSDRSKTLGAVKAEIRNLPAEMSKGQRALEALAIYRAARLPVPEEVLRQIDNCYRHFTQGKPVAFFTAAERDKPSPMTLGEAFGVPDMRGGEKIALKRKRLALASPKLVAMFTGQGRERVPRGRAYFGGEISKIDPDLSVSAVEDWLSAQARRASPKVGAHENRAGTESRIKARHSDAIANVVARWGRS